MKKTEMVGASVTAETKRKLQELARKKEWTLSHTINKILEEYANKEEKEGDGDPK